MTDFIVTKAECEARIEGVCPGCGGALTAIETVDNAHRPTHWQGCETCCVFTEGCDPKDHAIARQLVEEGTLVPYGHRDKGTTPGELAYWLHSNTHGAARILRRIKALLGEPS